MPLKPTLPKPQRATCQGDAGWRKGEVSITAEIFLQALIKAQAVPEDATLDMLRWDPETQTIKIFYTSWSPDQPVSAEGHPLIHIRLDDVDLKDVPIQVDAFPGPFGSASVPFDNYTTGGPTVIKTYPEKSADDIFPPT